MLNTKSVYEEPLDPQLGILLAQDSQLLLRAITRRMSDKWPLTDGEKIEQRICSLFMCLCRMKYAPDLEDKRRLLVEQQYSEQLSVLAKQLNRREQRTRLAELDAE